MDSMQIYGFLNELLKFRQNEFAQMVEVRCQPQLLDAYSARTSALARLIQEYESSIVEDAQFQQKTMTIDEAIQHCKDIANRSCKPCSVQHLQLASWLEELKSKDMRLKQLTADKASIQKQAAQDCKHAAEKAAKETVLKLLFVYDDLERCLAASSAYDEQSPLHEGALLACKNFQKALESVGCAKVEVAAGSKFDPYFQECICATRSSDCDPDLVLKVVRSGWTFNGQLLRPAQVITTA